MDNIAAIQMVSSLTSMSNPLLNDIELWNLKAKTWKNLCQVIGKKQAIDRNREETFWQSKLNNIEKDLQIRGNDEMLEAQLVKIKHNLNIIQRYKIQGQKIKARMNWINEGDKGSGYFFNIIKAKHRRELIDEIQVDGRNSKEPEDIQKAFYQFYKDLFS